MTRWLCFIIGHAAPRKGQHIAYRGLAYQWRCHRCGELTQREWSTHA